MKKIFIALAALMMMGSAHAVSVSYIDENGKEQTITSGFELVNDQTSHVLWPMQKIIVVGKDNNNDGTINAADATSGKTTFTFTNGLTIASNVTFIICDGFTLNLQAPVATQSNKINALELSSNAKLTFYGQKNGTGNVMMKSATQGTSVKLEQTVCCGQNSSLTFNGVRANILGPVNSDGDGFHAAEVEGGATMTVNSGYVEMAVVCTTNCSTADALYLDGGSFKVNDGQVILSGDGGGSGLSLGSGGVMEVAGGNVKIEGPGNGNSFKSIRQMAGSLNITAKGMKVYAGNSNPPTTVIPIAGDMAKTLKTSQYVMMETPIFTTRVEVNDNDTKTLESGMYSCPTLSDGVGAALKIGKGAKVTGEAVTFKNNKITGLANYGGAVSSYGNLILKDFAFINSYANNCSALYGWTGTKTQLTDGVFKGNSSNNNGAACFYGPITTIKNVQFIDNTCSNNGILELRTDDGDASLTNLKFENNSAKNGTLYVKALMGTTADSLEFIGNSATEQGGAIYVYRAMTLNHGTFKNNTANEGGAIYNNSKTLTLKKATFNGNSAKSGKGGAIYNAGTIYLQDSVILAGKSDSIYNHNEIQWEILGENNAKLFGYEKLVNTAKAKLSIVVDKEMEIGEYPIALGDLTDVTGKNNFTLKTAKDKTGKTISIDGKKVCYSNRLYSLFKKIQAPDAKQRLSEDSQNRKQFKIHEDTLILKVEPGICRIRETFYETLDSALKVVQKGDTIVLLADVEMEHSLELPAGTFLNLDGFKLTNPTGLDLSWNLQSADEPTIFDFDKLAADGTLTLNVAPMQIRKNYRLAAGAANSTGKKFVLKGAPTHDGKDRVVTVGGDSVFYGRRFFSLYINGNNEIVLRVTKVIPQKNEIWAISTDDNTVKFTNPQNFNASPILGKYVAADNITNIQFDGNITLIGMAAFIHNSKLKELYLPEGIELIAQDAVRDCQNLEYVSMLDSEATTIGPNAFEGCKKLSIIEWPEKLQTIDAFAFSYCDALDSLNLPASLKNIYGNAFSYNPNLKVVTLNTENMEHIWKESFDKCNADLTIYVPYLSLYSYNQIAAAKGLNFQTVIPMTSDGSGMIAFYSPNNFIVPAGAYVYNLKRTSATTTEADVEFSEGEVVAGGQGYLVWTPSLRYTDFQFVTTAEPTLKQALSILTGTYKPNTTFGALKAQTGATDLYLKDVDQTWNVPVTDDAEIVAPYTAILLKKGNDDIKLTFDESGNITAITALSTTDTTTDDLYNTAGQKVSDSYRGIVIKQGKKYMNK